MIRKNNLKNDINILENLLNGLENSIKEIKILFEKMNDKKEELKLKIQKVFTKIRNALNEREDELLLEVDNKFNELYINEELIRDSEKIPNKVKISLEKGKIIDNNWDDSNLYSLINDCINIENNIKDINLIKKNIEKFNPNNNIKIIDFKPDIHDDINPFLSTIKKFGFLCNRIDINLQSSILKSVNEIEFIITYLIKEENLNNKNLLLKLIFQATKDGKYASDFHKKCDGISPILVFIKTAKGIIFGGYTKEGFKSRMSYCIDNRAFVFSISKKKFIK